MSLFMKKLLWILFRQLLATLGYSTFQLLVTLVSTYTWNVIWKILTRKFASSSSSSCCAAGWNRQSRPRGPPPSSGPSRRRGDQFCSKRRQLCFRLARRCSCPQTGRRPEADLADKVDWTSSSSSSCSRQFFCPSALIECTRTFRRPSRLAFAFRPFRKSVRKKCRTVWASKLPVRRCRWCGSSSDLGKYFKCSSFVCCHQCPVAPGLNPRTITNSNHCFSLNLPWQWWKWTKNYK